MMQTAHSHLAADIDDLEAKIENVRDDLDARIENARDDLGADIRAVDERLRDVEIDMVAIRTAVIGLGNEPGQAELQSLRLDAADAGVTN